MKQNLFLILLLMTCGASNSAVGKGNTFYHGFDFSEIKQILPITDVEQLNLAFEPCSDQNKNKGALYDVEQAEINAIRDVESREPKIYRLQYSKGGIAYPGIDSTTIYPNVRVLTLLPTLNCDGKNLSKLAALRYVEKYNASFVKAFHFTLRRLDLEHKRRIKENEHQKKALENSSQEKLIEPIVVTGTRAIIQSSVNQKKIPNLILGSTNICTPYGFDNKGLLYDAKMATTNARRDLYEGVAHFYALGWGMLDSTFYPSNEDEIHEKSKHALTVPIYDTVKCGVDITQKEATRYAKKYNKVILNNWDSNKVLKSLNNRPLRGSYQNHTLASSFDSTLSDENYRLIKKALKRNHIEIDKYFDVTVSRLTKKTKLKLSQLFTGSDYCRIAIDDYHINKKLNKVFSYEGTNYLFKKRVGSLECEKESLFYLKSNEDVPDFLLDIVFDFFDLKQRNDKHGYSYRLRSFAVENQVDEKRTVITLDIDVSDPFAPFNNLTIGFDYKNDDYKVLYEFEGISI